MSENYSDQTIIRTVRNRDHPYSIISREPFNDKRLSWAARGLLGYLLTKPDDWEVRVGDLVKQYEPEPGHNSDSRPRGGGRDAVYTILRELKRYGYFVREPVRDEKYKNIVGWETFVYESPLTELPFTAEPDVGKPHIYIEGNLQNSDSTESSPVSASSSVSRVPSPAPKPQTLFDLIPTDTDEDEEIGIFTSEEPTARRANVRAQAPARSRANSVSTSTAREKNHDVDRPAASSANPSDHVAAARDKKHKDEKTPGFMAVRDWWCDKSSGKPGRTFTGGSDGAQIKLLLRVRDDQRWTTEELLAYLQATYESLMADPFWAPKVQLTIMPKQVQAWYAKTRPQRPLSDTETNESIENTYRPVRPRRSQ